MRRRRTGRLLSDAETALWKAVIREARPLRPIRRGVETSEAEIEQEEPGRQIVSKPKQNPMAHSAIETKPPRPQSPPPLTGLDRRTSQKLARGQIEADARLDLHGLRQDEAEDALFHFLSRCQAQGMRCVLIITGKGESPFARHTLHGRQFYEVPEHAGVLRGLLPRWLNEIRFRALAVGFQPAHPRHGGGGAFYIWLRRRS